jgi:predicted transcriptional regulator
MLKTEPVSARLEIDLHTRLKRLARTSDRSKSWHVNEALRQYFEYDAWFRAEVRKGMADARKNRTISHEDFSAQLDRKIERLKRGVRGRKG